MSKDETKHQFNWLRGFYRVHENSQKPFESSLDWCFKVKIIAKQFVTQDLIISTSTSQRTNSTARPLLKKHFFRFLLAFCALSKQTEKKFIYEILQEISHVSDFSFTSGKKREQKGTTTRHTRRKNIGKFQFL